MALVCPFWSNHVKTVEVCPYAGPAGGTYFLQYNLGDDGPLIDNPLYPSSTVGSEFLDAYTPGPYVSEATEVWATLAGFLAPAPPTFETSVIVEFQGGALASSYSWSMNVVSGLSATLEVVNTSLDMALLCFSFIPPGGIPPDPQTIFDSVYDFTPSVSGVAGPTIRLNARVVIFVS